MAVMNWAATSYLFAGATLLFAADRLVRTRTVLVRTAIWQCLRTWKARPERCDLIEEPDAFIDDVAERDRELSSLHSALSLWFAAAGGACVFAGVLALIN